jgi:tetratricopeptide (TPR) repeat protein
VHRALMQRELAAGNRAAALRWYARLREALQQGLGVTPDAQTQALYERCIAGLQAAGPAFVGRAQASAQAAAWLGMAAIQRPGGIVLRGPPGIGKSALGREIAAQARTRGWAVCCVEAPQNGRTYAVMCDITERLIFEDRSVLDRIGAQARAVLALLSPHAAPADTLPGPLGRHQVVGAIRRLLMAAAPGKDVLLLVDDAHLADDADVDVITQLAATGAGLCVLLAARPPATGTALARALGRLQRSGVLQVLDLEPLPDEECPPGGARRTRRRVRRRGGAHRARCRWQPLRGHRAGTLCRRQRRWALAWRRGRSHHRAAVRRARQRTESAQVDGPEQRRLRCRHRRGAGGRGTGSQPGIAGRRFGRWRAAAAGQPLPLPPPLGAAGAGRPGAAPPAHEDAPPDRRALGRAGQPAGRIARHWLEAGHRRDAMPWLLVAAREAVHLAAFSDALRHLEPLLAFQPDHAEGLRLRAESLDAMGEPAALAAYHAAADVAGEPESHNLRAKAALAQVKLGDPKGALVVLAGLTPASVEGRLCEALAYSGAAALGTGDPAVGTAKAAVARRLALQSGDTTSLVIASWAQAAAAHARGDLHRSVWADLHETSQVPHLALRVFDGHLCITQRFLYGARPYADVISFAQALSTEAQRLGAARGHAFGVTLRGEAEWLAGNLAEAREHLREGARLHRAIGGPVGEALSLQRLAELALHEGRRDEARALVDEALDVARQTDIGFHLLDRIYGTRINLHAEDPGAALYVMEDASASVRGPLETCPGCRITFAVPAAIAAARAGELDLAEKHAAQCAYLANVVMRLPAWYAAHDEVRGHIAATRGAAEEALSRFATAAARFREAGHPIDAERCDGWARRSK